MKGVFCGNKTTEEKLAATKRLIKVMLAFMFIVIGVVIYEMITMAVGDRTAFSNLGQICSTLGCLVCVLSLNIKRQKELEKELN